MNDNIGTLKSSDFAIKATGLPKAWPKIGGSRWEPWLETTTTPPILGKFEIPIVLPLNKKRKIGKANR